jgi:hypothetical protein
VTLPYAPAKEGYLKSQHRYYFTYHDSPPLLSYYAKQEDYARGRSPRGQILLIGCEIEKTVLIKDEPFSLVIYQQNGQKFVLCAASEEEMMSW